MGKADFLTAKAIGNRMKAKGLQKLRWFCQVCQKQCRDENGFKCHTTSESHQRQMLIVANNPDKFLSEYSDEFERTFLENLRRRHGTKRMAANVVYNEYIADKLHVHMNATQWTTLGGFVQYLGRTGKCVVDETEKGWFMQYIDRDPRTLARQEELEKKKKADLDHEERNRLFIERQLKDAQKHDGDDEALRPTKMQRRDGDDKISISLASTTKESSSQKTQLRGVASVFGLDGDSSSSGQPTGPSKQQSGRREIDALTQQFETRDQQHKRRREEEDGRRLDHWLTTGIVVKVLNKKVANGDYYKLKGEVVAVKDRYGATVEMLESGDVLQLDQEDLETVIPKVGRRVKIVNGVGRGAIAKLLSIDVDKFCVSLRIESGSRKYVSNVWGKEASTVLTCSVVLQG
jgi:DNA/RNA-binding protein KIN17